MVNSDHVVRDFVWCCAMIALDDSAVDDDCEWILIRFIAIGTTVSHSHNFPTHCKPIHTGHIGH